MRTILLAGDFKRLQSILNGLKGVRFIHCHSVDSLRNEWGKAGVDGVLVSMKTLSPSFFDLFHEAKKIAPQLRWAVFVHQGNVDLLPFSGEKLLFLKGDVAVDWRPRLLRFLTHGARSYRRVERHPCRGGVRVKESDFSRAALTGNRAYGKVTDVSSFGACFRFDEDPPFPSGEFLEVTFRDPQGVARIFHAQIRWKSRDGLGGTRVGVQFLAAAG